MFGHRSNGALKRLLSAGDAPAAVPAVDPAMRMNEERALVLVSAFEKQSTGWFWQTDRDGQVSYLSSKVAHHIATADLATARLPMVQLFRSDAQEGHSERTLPFHMSSRTGFTDLSVSTALDGDTRWWSISGSPQFDAFGQFEGFTGFGSDLTEKRRSEAEITKLALFDSLTGLANRQRMQTALEQILAASSRIYRPTALLLLDLDRFKAVNDTLGHQAGDALLQQVAHRLRRCCGEANLVGRLGGDEFKIIVAGENDREVLSAFARNIIVELSHPYFIDGSGILIGCSIGIALAPDDGDEPTALVRNADLALYAAKAAGRGVHRFYRNEMLAEAQTRKKLEDELRVALDRGGLSLVYQPLVRVHDQQIVGCEALMRWHHDVYGAISPAEFIPIAEECGLIEKLGEWALRTAVAEAVTWPSNVRVAVNVSAIQFANPKFPALVSNALVASGLDSDRLELEITESVFLTNSVGSGKTFRSLKALGVRLALDDFGTGYSALAYLKDAPFDKIKIDQSFVRGATVPGNRNVAIIQAIVTLADALGMETIVEGVETKDEVILMQQLGCGLIQGYVFSRPLTPDVLAQTLRAQGGSIAPVGFRISRSPRIRLLRWGHVECGDQRYRIKIRNISTSGVMIETAHALPVGTGDPVEVILWNDQRCPAVVRWSDTARIGLELHHALDLPALGYHAQA